MSSSSKKTTVQDMFQGARDAFEQMISSLSGAGLTQATESEVETQTAKQGTDLLRLLIQGHLDLRTAREQLELIPVLKARGDAVRCRLRALETRFGRVSFSRAGVIDSGAAKGTPARFPLDEELNVPPELYSHPLRRCAAEEVRKASFDEGVEALDRSTGGHVPKRQIEQLTERAAQDFEVFYEQKKAQEPEDSAALLLLSADAGGVRVRKDALRDATRKAAEKEANQNAQTPGKGDPMAPKKLRNHDKRMATVTLVADQARHVRTPEEIIANIDGSAKEKAAAEPKAELKPAKAPKPTHKTLLPSLVKPAKEAIEDMFDEADRRDPDKVRETVVLVDGQEQQKAAIRDQGKQRARTFTLIVDFIHILHYLWIAAKALRSSAFQWLWVAYYASKLLRCKTDRDVSRIAAGITRCATNSKLAGKALASVRKCTRYLLANKAHLHYATYLALGYPIATGAIEGAIRYLLRDRMDITGASWGLPCGEAVLRLRALHSNDDFDEYWEFHLRQEKLRHFPASPANDNACCAAVAA